MNFHPKNNSESHWQIQDASAKFSQLVEKAEKEGVQTITKRGKPIVVVLSKELYNELIRPSNSLLNFFKASPLAEVDLDITRSDDLPREVEL